MRSAWRGEVGAVAGASSSASSGGAAKVLQLKFEVHGTRPGWSGPKNGTAVKVFLFSSSPRPSCPKPLKPQTNTVPSSARIIVWLPPIAICLVTLPSGKAGTAVKVR